MSNQFKCNLAGLLAALGMALGSVPALAHHSFAAEFDAARPIELRGKVTKVELINPHSWLHVEVTRKDGVKESWMVEGGSPNALFRRGVTKLSIPIGAELVIVGYQARDGAHRAVGRTLKFANGEALFFGTPPTPGATK